MKLQLKILTPLHIGTGTEIEQLDYVVVNSNYYRLSQNFVNRFIDEHNLIDHYTKWINTTAEEICNIKRKPKNKRTKDQNQELSKLRSNLNLLTICEEANKKNELIKALAAAPDIIKIPCTGQPPSGKVREQITDGTLKPYIPGSSIKGAIRTAILFNWLNNINPAEKIDEIFQKELKKVNSKKETSASEIKKKAVTFASEIENLAFYCGIKEKNRDVNFTDEKFDLLKLLLVSDARIIAGQNPLTIIKTNLYLHDCTIQSQSPWVEALAPDTLAEFTMDFNINFLFTQKDKINNKRILINNTEQWINIETKTKELFGIDISSLNENNLEENRKKALDHVLKAISIFSKKQKEKNEEWKSKLKPVQNRGGQQALKKFDSHSVNFSFIPEDNALNLGFASGFIGTTEMLYLLENKKLKDRFKDIMKTFKIGKPRTKEKFTPDPDKFPKSRTMYKINNEIRPLGWVHILSNPQTYPDKSAEAHEKYRPVYYTGKLKPGAIVDAVYHSTDKTNPRSKYFKLFIEAEGKEQIVRLSYADQIPEETYFQVKIMSVRGTKVESIQIIKEIR